MDDLLRVASFNVKRLSAREKLRVDRIGAFVGALESDVVALQEIWTEPVADVARSAGFPHWTFVGHAPSRRRGVAMLHRVAASARGGERLSARPGDDKGYTRAVLRPRGVDVEVIGLHLDWISRRARSRQIDELARAVGQPRMPRVVIGDMNAMTLAAWARAMPSDDTVTELARALGVSPPPTAQATFPSRAPRWALDWILVSPPLRFADVRVTPTPLSDHAAIVADLVIGEDRRA